MNTKGTSTDVIRKALVFQTANKLLAAKKTVRVPEIRTELLKTHSVYNWNEAFVTKWMNEFCVSGIYLYDTTKRWYSDPVPSTVKAASPAKTKTKSSRPRLTKEKAADLMANNRGHMFTVTFVKKDGTTRRLNGQYQGTSKLGYIRMRDSALLKAKTGNPIRSINLQTMTELSIAGNVYKW